MNIQDQLNQEQIIRQGIIDLIDEVCRKAGEIYPEICTRANRSVEDKRKIVNMVFELVIAENSTITPAAALAQIENELGWTQE
jgi:hypothetical protein